MIKEITCFKKWKKAKKIKRLKVLKNKKKIVKRADKGFPKPITKRNKSIQVKYRKLWFRRAEVNANEIDVGIRIESLIKQFEDGFCENI